MNQQTAQDKLDRKKAQEMFDRVENIADKHPHIFTKMSKFRTLCEMLIAAMEEEE